jgi:hypothetical protein
MEQPTYSGLVNKILQAYKNLDFRPNPKIYFDEKKKECNPLVALAIDEFGIEMFMSMGKFFNYSSVYRVITRKFDTFWVAGFNDAFDNNEAKKWSTAYDAGYKVGKEVRRQLKEVYFKKPNPF